MTYGPSAHLPVRDDPWLDEFRFGDGVAFTIPPISAVPRPPLPGRTSFAWLEALNSVTKQNVSLINNSIKAGRAFEQASEFFDGGEIGRGRWKITEGSVRLGFLTKAAALKVAIAVAKPLARDERDVQALAKADAAASIVTSCGGAVLATIGAWGSFGVLTIGAVLQGIGCVKSIGDYLTLDEKGTTWFDRDAQAFGMSLETASFVGSVLSAGAGGLVKAKVAVTTSQFTASLFGRGAYAATKLERAGVALEGLGVTLKGVKYVVWPAPDGTFGLEPATPARIDTLTGHAGLKAGPGCFFPWPFQTEGLLGPCDPFWEDNDRVGRGQ